MVKILMLFVFFFSLHLRAQKEELALAVEMDDISKVSRMIRNGLATVDEKVRNEEPIILVAARAGAEKVTRYLISMKVNVNSLNAFRETALMMAVYFADSPQDNSHVIHDRIAKLLVDAGANLENEQWWTPLTYSAYAGRSEITKYLLSQGALIDGPVINNITPIKTPLMMATLEGHEKLVHFLLIQGANANIETQNHSTAYSFAEKNNFNNLLKYLKCAMNLKDGETYQSQCEK